MIKGTRTNKPSINNIESINVWYCGLGYLKKMYVNDTTIFNNIKNIQDKLYFIAEKELYK